MIVCTCGHRVKVINDTVNCALARYDRMNERCVVYGTYCKPCYEQFKKDGEVLFNEGEENKWMRGK